ncbi:hormonally up-regulated neu tumor-associated kinase-like [Lemur catta]|uniref:hormonally up-regulated neu tumor-associated kinase-like n=1 Tax=Lemur catta TaxID=9447 RepID=UPI001E26A266|nr:hormonally up-regulated neu tumor-associated kinase-like [Lemur catta]
MPAAAGDGLLGEPAAPGGGGGAEDAARPAAACEGSFLPAWVSGVPRERLRDFQHHKRVGNYLIGSRKLGEGSFAKVREGLHVLTGEKVSPARSGCGTAAGGAAGAPPRALHWESGCVFPGPAPPPDFPLGLKESSQTRAQVPAAGSPGLSDGRSGVSVSPRGG